MKHVPNRIWKEYVLARIGTFCSNVRFRFGKEINHVLVADRQLSTEGGFVGRRINDVDETDVDRDIIVIAESDTETATGK